MRLYKLKLCCLAWIYVLCSNASHGQLTISEFLRSAEQDPQLNVFSTKLTFLNEKSYRLAPIKNVELRTQNNQLRSGEQQYGIKVTPVNPWLIRNNNRLYDSYRITLSLEKDLVLKNALEKRYQLVIELLHLSEMHRIREELLNTIVQQIRIYEQQKASDFFDPEEYVELKLSLLEEKSDAESLSFDLNQKLKEIDRLYPDASITFCDWSYESIVPLPKLENLLTGLLNGPLYSTRIAYHKEKITLADNAYLLEKSNINIGSAQTEYLPASRESNKKADLGITLGVTIPLFNPNKGEMAAKRLKIIEAKSALSIEKQQAEAELKMLLESLKNSIRRYNLLDQELASYNVNETIRVISSMNKNNPLVTLKLKSRLLKLEKAKSLLKSQLYQTYVKILAATDVLNQKPLLNLLAEELTPL
jgi:hypothetical protein